MQVIERCPRTEVDTEVALFERAPDALTIGHAAYVALSPFWVVLGVGIGTELQLANHILHAPTALLIARSGILGHCRQIVTTHVSVEPVPVGIGFGTRLQSCLFTVGSQQAVAIVLQQRLDIQVACMFQRTVE